jgi:hypothetical protein
VGDGRLFYWSFAQSVLFGKMYSRRPDAWDRLKRRRRALALHALDAVACAQRALATGPRRWTQQARALGTRRARWAERPSAGGLRARRWAGRRRARALGAGPRRAQAHEGGSWRGAGARGGNRELGRALSWPTREGWRGWAEGEEREGKGGAGGLPEMGQGRGLGHFSFFLFLPLFFLFSIYFSLTLCTSK